MDTVRVDTALLRTAGKQLRVVADEFQQANANSDDAADAIGHNGLADAVRRQVEVGDRIRQVAVEGVERCGDGVAFRADLDDGCLRVSVAQPQ